MIEFVPAPERGRTFSIRSKVRLSDVTTGGALRLDGIARMLQDVATDDWADSGIATDVLWVARRTAFRFIGDSWPQYETTVSAMTWCSGTGAAWAERRTNLMVDGHLILEAASLWVPIDQRGFPQRIPPSFATVYGEAMAGRKVPGRVRTSQPSLKAEVRPYGVRRSDLDIIGHVNNAAIWQAIAEVVDVPVGYVEVVHHGPVTHGHEVTLAWEADEVWLLVDGEVRVSAYFVRR